MIKEYKQFEEIAWSKFGQNLLREEDQKKEQFLDACKSGKNDFLGYIDERLLSYDVKGGELIDWNRKLTESEFHGPPPCTQEFIWKALKNVPFEILQRCGFWGYVIREMIESSSIEPIYLADRDQIDKALKGGKSKIIDDACRRILRSMCNPAPRGKRIVFNDFYLGKAYWRWYWAMQISELNLDLEFKDILEIFDEKYYSQFAAKMHSSKGQSYIGSKNILSGLLLFLKQRKDIDKKITGPCLNKIINNIAYLSAWKAIEIQDPVSNQKEIEEIAKQIQLLR